MPFAPLDTPSIALGILKACLNQANFEARCFYFSRDFTHSVGRAAYRRIAAGMPSTDDLAGEWVFSALPRRSGSTVPSAPPDGDFVEDVLLGGLPQHTKNDQVRRLARHSPSVIVDQVCAARRLAPRFIQESLSALEAYAPDVVGFSCVFQQTLASVALAEAIKQKLPEALVVFGGASCEDPMGAALLQVFPAIDVVVSGEGEAALVALLERLRDGERFVDLPGIRTRHVPTLRQLASERPAPLVSLEALPTPNYDEFFSRDVGDETQLVFETARGCWWGAKHHCTFCGLNGATLDYRSKSPDRALRELEELVERYGDRNVVVVDNILAMNYFDSLLLSIAAKPTPRSMFWETKANLKREQIRILREARVTTIQPGIESLSDDVLRLIRKGVRGIQNVQTLKWCQQDGINVEWNYLWGFPGEPQDAYREIASSIPSLVHLQPPGSMSAVRLDRFSPLFDAEAARDTPRIGPFPSYAYVYGVPDVWLRRLAYFFSYDDRTSSQYSYTDELVRQLLAWRECHHRSALIGVEVGRGKLLLVDTRPCATAPATVLSGGYRELYSYCDAYRSLSQLEAAAVDGTIPLTPDALPGVLDELQRRKLIFLDGEACLSLALWLDGRYSPRGETLASVAKVLGEHSRPAGCESRVLNTDILSC
jgi:ribosomal peptide maturation radical SAM protein 1